MPELKGHVFSSNTFRKASFLYLAEPGFQSQSFAQGTELFAAHGEDFANPVPLLFGKEEGGFSELEAHEYGVDVGDGVEAGFGDGMLSGVLVGGLEEEADGADGFGTGLGEESGGGFFLDEEDHALGECSCEDGFEPWTGDGVGQIGDDSEVCVGGEVADGGVYSICFEEVEFAFGLWE